MAEMLSLKEVRLPVESGQSYPQVGIRGFGGGLFAKAAVSLSETTYRFFHLLHEDDFVVSQVKGWEGAVAVCDRTYAGLFASPEYRTFACNPDMLNPRYWSFIVRTEWFQGFLKQLSRGQGARRERLRPEMLLNLDLPVPRLADQLRLLPTFELVERLRSEDITEELDAILPAALDSALNGRL
jgi:type I restriction enzyme S subunit